MVWRQSLLGVYLRGLRRRGPRYPLQPTHGPGGIQRIGRLAGGRRGEAGRGLRRGRARLRGWRLLLLGRGLQAHGRGRLGGGGGGGHVLGRHEGEGAGLEAAPRRGFLLVLLDLHGAFQMRHHVEHCLRRRGGMWQVLWIRTGGAAAGHVSTTRQRLTPVTHLLLDSPQRGVPRPPLLLQHALQQQQRTRITDPSEPLIGTATQQALSWLTGVEPAPVAPTHRSSLICPRCRSCCCCRRFPHLRLPATAPHLRPPRYCPAPHLQLSVWCPPPTAP